MSSLEITACDGCGTQAPHDYVRGFPSGEWMTVRRRSGRTDLDVCSMECWFDVAAKMTGRQYNLTSTEAEVASLEATFLASPAVRPIPRKRPKAGGQ